MPVETELKLNLTPDDFPHVSRMGLIRRLTSGRAVRQRTFSVYYDTPGLDLYRRGMVYRVRRQGRRWVQTLKTGNASGALYQQRGEYESPTGSAAPDLGRLASAYPIPELDQVGIHENLRPQFETDFWRTTWNLHLPNGSIVHLSLDTGEVRKDGNIVPIGELELELKQGLPDALFDLALEIAESLNVRMAGQTKADKGYRLLAEKPRYPARARPPELGGDMTVEEAFAAILWSALRQIQDNEEPVLLGEDIEGVHQMRVGLRRFRSCLTLFNRIVPRRATREIRDGLRLLTEPLGPARDWDVLWEEHLRPWLASLPAGHPAHALAGMVERKRRTCYETLRQSIRSRDYNRLILRVSSWIARREWRAMEPEELARLADPVRPRARALLRRGHRRILKLGDSAGFRDERQLHDWRIQIKRQRYSAEFFEALFPPKDARNYRAGLSDLQERLGSLNDAATAKALLRELKADNPTVEALVLPDPAETGGPDGRAPGIRKTWKRFRKTTSFWA